MTQGDEDLALLKSSLMALSDSPTYLFSNSGPFIDMKLALLSLATALANKVLPHPGGPKSKTPAGGVILKVSNFSGSRIGQQIEVSSSSLRLLRAPISSQVVPGITENP